LHPPAPSRYRVEPGRRAQASERRRLRRELEVATAASAFELHYQPRFCLTSGEQTGAEALLRWPHRKGGVVPSTAFLPLANEFGQIAAIDGWALQTACTDAHTWAYGIVSLNVSTRQLAEGALLSQIAAALEASGLPAERLEIELSETTLVDVGVEALLALSAIRDLGVGLALDDFGSVVGSLSMLKRLPLTVLKLDRSLLRDLPHDHEEAAIVRAAIMTGHALGLCVVADGLEREEQRAFLAGAGCDEGQGCLFSQPQSGEDVRSCLATLL
jgi:EAL domain-containing protein (putative c-di-GMP-specific phosphodiesterase class I)